MTASLFGALRNITSASVCVSLVLSLAACSSNTSEPVSSTPAGAEVAPAVEAVAAPTSPAEVADDLPTGNTDEAEPSADLAGDDGDKGVSEAVVTGEGAPAAEAAPAAEGTPAVEAAPAAEDNGAVVGGE